MKMVDKNSRILKVAGLSLVGFCAVSLGADRTNIGPVASQLAGFCGAFLGGWVGSRRKRKTAGEHKLQEGAAASASDDAKKTAPLSNG